MYTTYRQHPLPVDVGMFQITLGNMASETKVKLNQQTSSASITTAVSCSAHFLFFFGSEITKTNQ